MLSIHNCFDAINSQPFRCPSIHNYLDDHQFVTISMTIINYDLKLLAPNMIVVRVQHRHGYECSSPTNSDHVSTMALPVDILSCTIDHDDPFVTATIHRQFKLSQKHKVLLLHSSCSGYTVSNTQHMIKEDMLDFAPPSISVNYTSDNN